MARKLREKQVSRPEIAIALAFVVETLEAYENRGANLCLLGGTAYENSLTRTREN
jgi:hypothetical protein